MRIVTKREKIRSVRGLWNSQYSSYTRGHILYGGRCVGEIEDALARLDLDVCADTDIDAAIGTKGWGSLVCDECHADTDALVRIGDEPDYDMRWQDLCAACVGKAAQMLSVKKRE